MPSTTPDLSTVTAGWLFACAATAAADWRVHRASAGVAGARLAAPLRRLRRPACDPAWARHPRNLPAAFRRLRGSGGGRRRGPDRRPRSAARDPFACSTGNSRLRFGLGAGGGRGRRHRRHARDPRALCQASAAARSAGCAGWLEVGPPSPGAPARGAGNGGSAGLARGSPRGRERLRSRRPPSFAVQRHHRQAKQNQPGAQPRSCPPGSGCCRN